MGSHSVTYHKWTRPTYPSHAGWYWIYLPWRDGRLSWPSWLDSTPARSQSRVQRTQPLRHEDDQDYGNLYHTCLTYSLTLYCLSVQLVSDMVSVSESTGWSRQCPTLSKYRALRCKLVPVTPDMRNDCDTIMDFMKGEQIERSVHFTLFYLL